MGAATTYLRPVAVTVERKILEAVTINYSGLRKCLALPPHFQLLSPTLWSRSAPKYC
jgi:hypothetical protein